MTDQPTLWACGCLVLHEFDANEFIDPDRETAPDFNFDVSNQLLRGFAVAPEKVYGSMHIINADEHTARFPDFFTIALPVVSERFIDVITAFDLGETVFYPIDLYQSDRKTKRADRYFIMNIRSQKQCWVEDATEPLCFSRVIPDYALFSGEPRHENVVVNDLALEGADLWVDPNLLGCLFFSDRLKRAMEASDLSPQFKYWRCAITPVQRT